MNEFNDIIKDLNDDEVLSIIESNEILVLFPYFNLMGMALAKKYLDNLLGG